MHLSQSSRALPFPAARLALLGYLIAVAALSFFALAKYPGNAPVFLLFAVLGNALLLNGFRASASYFDTFIGIFFWLGFFLKLAVRVAFCDGRYAVAIGAFDGSGPAYDRALTVIAVAFAALLLSSLLRERFFRYPANAPDCSASGLYRYYCTHRRAVLTAFIALVLVVTISNAWLGVYQRGLVARTVLPFGLSGIYKWLLQFGLASVSALVIRFEIARSRSLSNTAIFIPLLEGFLCNVSLLSRGMVLNASGVAVGGWRLLQATRAALSLRRVAVAGIAFMILFGSSVFAVNFLRTQTLHGYAAAEAADEARSMSRPLFIDRWVGLEGVLAVTASKDLGWDLWHRAWQEKYDESQLSLFDSHFIDSPYKYLDEKNRESQSKHFHFVSLPGLVAFLFYTGSLGFVFAGTLLFALAAVLLEIGFYRWCGRNVVLCSLFAQVIAFRYASFGYVPAQSYLLFGTLVMNGVLIAGADFLLSRWYRPGKAR